jgi:hypothetical protein
MKKIELYDEEQTCLIIPAKTGFMVSNQTWGLACGHPEIEGFLIPLRYDCTGMMNEICCSKYDPKFIQKWFDAYDMDFLKPLTLQELNEFIDENGLDWYKQDDKRKGLFGSEAWIACKIEKVKYGFPTILDNFVGEKVILTYPNSD